MLGLIVFVVPREDYIEKLTKNFYASFCLFRQEMAAKNIEILSVVKEKFNQLNWQYYRKDEILFIECGRNLIDKNKASYLEKHHVLTNVSLLARRYWGLIFSKITELRNKKVTPQRRVTFYDEISSLRPANEKSNANPNVRSLTTVHYNPLHSINTACNELEKIFSSGHPQVTRKVQRAPAPIPENFIPPVEENRDKFCYVEIPGPDTSPDINNALKTMNTNVVAQAIERGGIPLIVELMVTEDVGLRQKELLLKIYKASSVRNCQEELINKLLDKNASQEIIEMCMNVNLGDSRDICSVPQLSRK